MEQEFQKEYTELNSRPSALIVRWLTGANYGSCGSLYISNRGKGTSLFLVNSESRSGDIRLATLTGKTLKIVVVHDAFNIAQIASRLGIKTVEFPLNSFRSDGTINRNILDGNKTTTRN